MRFCVLLCCGNKLEYFWTLIVSFSDNVKRIKRTVATANDFISLEISTTKNTDGKACLYFSKNKVWPFDANGPDNPDPNTAAKKCADVGINLATIYSNAEMDQVKDFLGASLQSLRIKL